MRDGKTFTQASWPQFEGGSENLLLHSPSIMVNMMVAVDFANNINAYTAFFRLRR